MLRPCGRAPAYVAETKRMIQRLIDELSLRYLRDIRAEAVEHWLAQKTKAEPNKSAMSARTRNSYLIAMRGFCNWCVERDRLPFNPLARISQADEKVDRRRQRRALTEAELSRLLIVARLRPLAEFGRETIKKAIKASSTPEKRRRGRESPWSSTNSPTLLNVPAHGFKTIRRSSLGRNNSASKERWPTSWR